MEAMQLRALRIPEANSGPGPAQTQGGPPFPRPRLLPSAHRWKGSPPWPPPRARRQEAPWNRSSKLSAGPRSKQRPVTSEQEVTVTATTPVQSLKMSKRDSRSADDRSDEAEL